MSPLREDEIMESYSITKIGETFHIDGFPDAVKLLALSSPNAKRLADLFLHRSDLAFALECLEEINRVPTESAVTRRALWHSAIIHFMKCFGGSNSRDRLKFDDLFPNEAGALTAFNFFKSLRDKHIAHDENAWAQCLPSAVLNKKGAEQKIAKVICSGFTAWTLEQSNYSNLRLLISRSLEWLTENFDQLCDTVVAELETLSYEELYERDGVKYQAPGWTEVHKNRPTL